MTCLVPYAALAPGLSGSAAAAPCNGPLVLTDAAVSDGWMPALRDLQARLAQFPGLDACATVRISEQAGLVFAQVLLADGRTARRRVENRTDLVPVVASLVTSLPELEASEPGGQSPSVAPASPSPIREAAAARYAAEPASLALEIGLGGAARLAGSPRYVGYGLTAHFDLVVDAWLFGVWARWDIRDHPRNQNDLPGDLDMASVLVGAFFGRRIALGHAALDLLLGPNVLFENQEARNGNGPGEVGGVFTDLSVAALLRLVLPRTGTFHFFALVGGEIYPLRAANRVERDPSLPDLPTFAATFAMGTAWSSR